MNKNTTKYQYKVTCDEKRKMNGHNSFLVFFTGLSGAGKSTIANGVEQRLFQNNIRTYVLDGDNIRRGINRNLGFSPKDRSENNRRIGEISKLFIEAGVVVLAAFVAPYQKDREFIKQTVGNKNYVEVYMATSLEECERRDVKGLYKKARTGQIHNMTGISAPYEVPKTPDIELTELNSIEESIEIVLNKINDKLGLPILN